MLLESVRDMRPAGVYTYRRGRGAIRPAEPRARREGGRPRADLVRARVSARRFNELRGEEVVYAVDRQERTFLPDAEHCPLCPTRPGGAVTEIPLESFEIAVFENRFPTFAAP